MTEDDESTANEAQSQETILHPEAESRDTTGDEFSPFDEIAEEYKPSEIKKITAADGMPTQVAPQQSNDIPPLSPESLVCMEDVSSFVLRDMYGRVVETFSATKVIQQPNGKYYVGNSDPRGNQDRLLEVHPIRPRCEFYVRQMAMFDYNPEGKVHLRLCSARRTTEGTFMTVRDSAMWACSMRSPRDLKTEEECLNKFDREKVEQGKARQHFSIFKKE